MELLVLRQLCAFPTRGTEFKAIPGCPRPFIVAVMRVTPLCYPFAMQYRLKD